ncbi:acyltransferase [Pseudoroseomonas cervicalis]|uniref:acyltransferase family protein n=1 Tax=Teichococcus cervicalis TaxID=204525 RepID=UPI00278A9F45|nr:acyltransferase [Pseudoroseomonas cervicalis]MDQ1078671.1 peptidoglycan/LPS O-acetylase OafA/YrhL [Pseudoroseomonas cervicalis]
MPADLPASTTARPPAARLVELDSLRGIAALIVVLHHVWLTLPDLPRWLVWAVAETPLRPLATGRQAVVFFFVLSGYVLTRALARQEARSPGSVLSWPGWAHYAVQRALRLGLPVLGALLLSAALQSLTWRAPLPPGSPHIVAGAAWAAPWNWPDLLGQALLLRHGDGFQLNPVLWSLVHEWRIALLLPLALLLRHRPEWLLAIALLGAGVARLAGMPEGQVSLGGSLPATFAASAGFLPAFATGAVLALRPPKTLDSAQALAAGLAVLVMAMAAHDYGVIAGSALLILLAQRDGPFARSLRHPGLLWLGKISFSLYLAHMPVLLALTHALRDRAEPWQIGALAVLLSLPVAALMFRLVERPAHHLARALPPFAPTTPRSSPATAEARAR